MPGTQIDSKRTKISASATAMTAARPADAAAYPNGADIPRALDRLLPLKEVMGLTSLSKASIYRRFPESFPAPVKCGASRVAWRRSDIEKWLADRKPVSKLKAAA